MNGKQLRNSILQWAISGRLVPQDPNDEPAIAILRRINPKAAPIVPDDAPFTIPDNWCWCRMQDVIEFVNGRAYKKEELLEKGKYKVLRVGNFFTNSTWYYSDLELADDKYCNKGDLLYAWSASFGPQIWNGDKTIFHYHIWNVRFNSSILYRDYLYYFLLYDKTQIQGSTTGSTMVHVSMENMKPRLIPLPPLAEQERIVRKVEELLPLVERYDKAQTELDRLNASLKGKLRASVLQEAIAGRLVPQDPNDEPAIALLRRINPKAAPLNPDDAPFSIPDSWCWCKFSQIVKFRIGKTPPRGDDTYWANGVDNWVSISDMTEYGHIKSTKEKVSSNSKAIMGEVSSIGTLIMSFKLTVGRTSILEIPSYHNEAIISIFPYIDKDYALRNYLFYILPVVSNYGESKDAIKGKTLNSKSISELLIPLPPLAEQERIVRKVEELFAVLDALQ